MFQDHNAPPLNPIPWVVWLLLLPIVAMEAAVSLGASGLAGGAAGVGWRIQAVQDFAFSPRLFDWMVQSGQYRADILMRLVTYPFVHVNPTHAIFVAVFLLALGKFVGEAFRPISVLIIFFGAAVAGALTYWLLASSPMVLIGGYPPDYGLIGAFTFILWTRLGSHGQNRYGAFSLIGFLLGIQLLFALLFGGGQEWIADLAGFAAGFGLSFVVGPGGFQKTLARIRHR